MAIITLTTDLGHKDFYLAALKGSIYTQLPDVQVVDISHEVADYNIAQAAFIIRNSYAYFPKRTVHVIGIDCNYADYTRFLALAYDGHYFIGADNGLFSLFLDGAPTKMVEIDIKSENKFQHFPLKDIMGRAACHLANGGLLDSLGKVTTEMEEKKLLQPVREAALLKGSIIYIDAYQNAITNITYSLFQEVRAGRRFRIRFRRSESIHKISQHYNDVPEGEKLCLFGISNHLEIAINKGKAAGLLGLRLNEVVAIDFLDEPSGTVVKE